MPSSTPTAASQPSSRFAFAGEKPSAAFVVVCTFPGSSRWRGLSGDPVSFKRIATISLTELSTPVAIRKLARHRHDVGARDIPDIDVVVRLAAIARNDRPLAGFDALVRFDDMQRVHASVMLPLSIDGRIAQRDVLEPVALFVQAQQVLADDLARGV